MVIAITKHLRGEQHVSYKIKITQLRAYQAIMSTGSVTAAAERLFTSQPNLSRQLALLEEATGLCLFDRTSGGRMVPTSSGLAFFRQIEGTLSGIEQIPEVAHQVLHGGREKLRLGATPPLLHSAFLSDALKTFLKSNSQVRIALESRPRRDIEEWIASGQIDVGLALLPVENPYLITIPLIETAAVAVVPIDHPLSERPRLGPEDIEEFSLILPAHQLLRERIDKTFATLGHTLQPDIEASSALACCKYTDDGFGITLCDPFSPTAFNGNNLKVIELFPKVSLSYGVILAKGRRSSDLVEAMITCLEHHAQELSQK